jgi:two-component system nitrogen regulation response regulator GlnG
MASGQFREDLFFRLSVFPIRVPPLRDRPEDIPALAAHFLGEFGDRAGGPVTLRADLVRELMARPWTGNVRELRNAVERAAIVARCRDIRLEHLPPPAIGTSIPEGVAREGLSDRVARWVEDALSAVEPTPVDQGSSGLHDRFLSLVEPPLLRAVLRRSQGNRAMAARQLGIHRATLRQKMKRYHLGASRDGPEGGKIGVQA